MFRDTHARETLSKNNEILSGFPRHCRSPGVADASFYTEGKLLSGGGSIKQLQEQKGYFKGDYSGNYEGSWRMIRGYSAKITLN